MPVIEDETKRERKRKEKKGCNSFFVTLVGGKVLMSDSELRAFLGKGRCATKRWAVAEFFYSDIDEDFFRARAQAAAEKKPRRFSAAFVASELAQLEAHRAALSAQMQRTLRVGTVVDAALHGGVVLRAVVVAVSPLTVRAAADPNSSNPKPIVVDPSVVRVVATSGPLAGSGAASPLVQHGAAPASPARRARRRPISRLLLAAAAAADPTADSSGTAEEGSGEAATALVQQQDLGDEATTLATSLALLEQKQVLLAHLAFLHTQAEEMQRRASTSSHAPFVFPRWFQEIYAWTWVRTNEVTRQHVPMLKHMRNAVFNRITAPQPLLMLPQFNNT